MLLRLGWQVGSTVLTTQAIAGFEAEVKALGKEGETLEKFVEDCCHEERLAAKNVRDKNFSHAMDTELALKWSWKPESWT